MEQGGLDLAEVSPEDYDRKWHFVPPAGERPVTNKWGFLAGILIVLVLEFILWGIYRATTAPLYGEGFNVPFFLGHIVAAPTIHLGPILLYWILFRKEKLFRKEDRDGSTHTAFSLGPFKMTRRLLLTAVLVGLFGGIVWRVTEMLVGDIFSIMFGGSVLGQLNLFNVYATNEFGVFLLMTFVMFFVVGPVEEFEFRSFVHDQSARVLPMWQALIFSSMMFGFSHIPIAIFIYKLPFIDLVVAEISWMTAGAVFGALYMWSRNIFACIVMHGIGNWQLSTFLLQSTTNGSGLEHTQYLIVSLLVSVFANGILIGLFYLIHKYYWEPQRRGEPAFGGKLEKVQKALFSQDVGTGSPIKTGAVLTVVTVVTLVVLAGGANVFGTSDFSLLGPQAIPAGNSAGSYGDWEPVLETTPVTGTLNVGQDSPTPLSTSELRLIRSVNATLTWTDELDMRRIVRTYENQPDTFRLSMTGPNISVEEEAANVHGEEGMITLSLDLDDDQITALGTNSTITVTVTLVEAGLFAPGIGVIGFTDTGNEFMLTIETTYLEKPLS